MLYSCKIENKEKTIARARISCRMQEGAYLRRSRCRSRFPKEALEKDDDGIEGAEIRPR